jgi:hypothetical protein
MADSYTDQLKKLSGPQRSAASALIELFNEYGLTSLAGSIIGFIKQGYSSDTISVLLRETPQYKQRFAANEARKKRGLNVLSPKEYIETERAYRQVMSSAGMPKGFYDQNSDFQKFLENDMSATELNDRVKSWQEYAQSDQTALSELRRLYGMSASDAAAFAMDPSRALPLIQKQARSVGFAAAAARHGYQIGLGTAEMYGGGAYNVTGEDAEKGFSAIQEIQGETDKLAKIYGLGDYSVEDAAAEVFGGDQKQAAKRKKLASQERGAFSDKSKGKTGSASKSNY